MVKMNKHRKYLELWPAPRKSQTIVAGTATDTWLRAEKSCSLLRDSKPFSWHQTYFFHPPPDSSAVPSGSAGWVKWTRLKCSHLENSYLLRQWICFPNNFQGTAHWRQGLLSRLSYLRFNAVRGLWEKEWEKRFSAEAGRLININSWENHRVDESDRTLCATAAVTEPTSMRRSYCLVFQALSLSVWAS